jgi:hypothetical protein
LEAVFFVSNSIPIQTVIIANSVTEATPYFKIKAALGDQHRYFLIRPPPLRRTLHLASIELSRPFDCKMISRVLLEVIEAPVLIHQDS